jgi:bis(5'-nucleosyl)-tetraphosphatase (symmetrical)
MSTYAIGDIQGCFDPFKRLLDKIKFDESCDQLWLTGDLVNRGPQSLETLRFIKSLGKKAITVLGNHDLTLLAVAYNTTPFDPQHHTFSDILNAPDKDPLIQWLRQQPLFVHDETLGFSMVHAGVHPHWDLSTTQQLAREAETILQGSTYIDYLSRLYGNYPLQWDPSLTGFDRFRFIINCFTRLRLCRLDGVLDLTHKDALDHSPTHYFPWYAIPTRKSAHLNLIFGHWAALKGQCDARNTFALDTGCVWGECLTAMRLEDGERLMVSC